MAHLTDWPSLSTPENAEWSEFVKTVFGGVAPDLGLFPDIPTMRQWIEGTRHVAPPVPILPGVKEADHQVPMRDGVNITCRVYSPESPPAGGSPLFVAYHGGGWCVGGLDNEEWLCRLVTSKLGVTCVNVDYRMAPEHKFPIPANDCHDATKWVAANAATLGANPSKGFVIGGTSAGGNLTAVVALLFRDEGITPKITGCLYKIPMYIDPDKVPAEYQKDYISFSQNADAAILGNKAMYLFRDNYLNNVEERGNPLFCPILWETGHSNLPASAFQVCGADPLRDDALIFERKLREKEGIKTRMEMYPGLPHGFWSVAPPLEVSKQFMADSVDCLKWLLEQA